jgi:alkylated DNA repair dioxygenase AlkB
MRQTTLFFAGRGDGTKKKQKNNTYEKCPICGTQEHVVRLQEHVNACLDEHARREKEEKEKEQSLTDAENTETLASKNCRKRKAFEEKEEMPPLPIPTAKTTATKKNNAFQKIKRGSIEMSKISSPSHIYGHKVIENFITEEEEEELLRAVYDMSEQTWNDRNASGNGRHNGKSWGVNADRARRKVFKAKREMPEAFQRIVLEKLRANDYGYKGLREFGFACNECNAIEYIREKGHELRPHVDDRILSSDIIINLSMVGTCIMRYRMNKNQGIEIAKKLPRFSLQIQGGRCRFEWEHGIRNEDLIDGKRVSLTFRCSGRGNGKDGMYKDVVFEEAPRGYVNDLEGRDRR